MKNIKIHQIVYIGLLLFLVYSLFGSLRLFLKARNTLSDAQIILELESQRNNELHGKLLEVGKQIYIERVARDTLGLAHENEIVFIMPSSDEIKKLSPRLSNQQLLKSAPQIPHWEEWFNLFM